MKVTRNFISIIFIIAAFALTALAQNSGGIKGKVRNAKGGGIAGAIVTARQKGVDIKTVKSDSKGDFLIAGLDSGLYNLVFDANGYSSGVLYNVEVKKKKTTDLGEKNLILSTDQGTLVIIKGSVFYKDGTSITGAKVEIEKINSDGSVKKLGSGLTNISGEFTFRQKEGAAKLRIKASYKGVSGMKEIEVDMAAIYRLAITLDISQGQNREQ